MSKELTPSMAPKLAECAVFVGSSGASEAAQRGTAIDYAIRMAMDGNPIPLSQLNREDCDAATWGIETLNRLSGGEHIETREEYLAMAVPGLSKLGTADALCKRGRWVADVKSGQVRPYRKQVAAYALACMEDHFAESWTAHVIYIDQRLVRSYDFTRAEAEATTQRWIAEATSEDAKPTPCEYCGWCANFNSCGAIVRQAESALELVTSYGRTVDEIRAEIVADPIKMSVFAANWKTAEKHIAEPVLDALRARLEAKEEIPGWKLTNPKEKEYIEANTAVETASKLDAGRAFLIGGGKMSAEKFLELAEELQIENPYQFVKTAPGTKQMRQVTNKTK